MADYRDLCHSVGELIANVGLIDVAITNGEYPEYVQENWQSRMDGIEAFLQATIEEVQEFASGWE